ncbi:hypothetical protein DCO58_11815 [Helicobacter saguini]|uniref:Uncharacterized protein n=1 Tax=Helicobacter saguini TaxID=1548018 RepID=A0A6B0HVZ9_9HELI|nr:hypothetical protein [Helicobacter saguini]MWV61025.1 hypothetical protein [Helicobacter saguini]MWV68306.1 hypothetical protein [Helicobacter saguini]MWV70229.1 hypothetical protein [Helicobacter saguini]MWV72132.1 hypothetical protein [Helicobacter saguini]
MFVLSVRFLVVILETFRHTLRCLFASIQRNYIHTRSLRSLLLNCPA